jgi:hypothetical protein
MDMSIQTVDESLAKFRKTLESDGYLLNSELAEDGCRLPGERGRIALVQRTGSFSAASRSEDACRRAVSVVVTACTRASSTDSSPARYCCVMPVTAPPA